MGGDVPKENIQIYRIYIPNWTRKNEHGMLSFTLWKWSGV
jgi:hypothetical protein